MAVGAGSTAGQPSVLQYSSADLRTWRPDGVLAAPEPSSPGPGGSVWECPQLFPVADAWALVVSVWDEQPGPVACALGDYDGRRFTPRAWHQLATGPCYATTVFLDAEGRRCAFSWLQETGDPDGAWAGALSVPWLLDVAHDRVVVRPHPDVDTLRTGVHAHLGPGPLATEPLTLGVPAHADLVLRAHLAGEPLTLTLDEPTGRLLTVVADPAAGELLLSVPAGPESRAGLRPGPGGVLDLRLLIDAGVVEAFPGGGAVAASRLRPVGGEVRLGISAAGAGARLQELVVHGMERAIG
jgi:beta-fructofuranosidase